jgi:hypothetical protein
VDELLRDTVGLAGEILQGSAKQTDNLRGAAYNGSDGRLGGRTAATTLSIWRRSSIYALFMVSRQFLGSRANGTETLLTL